MEEPSPTMDAHPTSDDIEQELRGSIATARDIIVLDPSVAVIHSLIDILISFDEPPQSRVLAAESALKSVRDHTSRAAHAAELVNEGSLQLRSLGSPQVGLPPLIVSDDHVHSLVVLDSVVSTISRENTAMAASVENDLDEFWEAADSFDLRTPGWSHMLTSLEDRFGTEVATDFERVLSATDDADIDSSEIDEIAIAIFAASANGVLLYDIGRWGEDIGFASKATFSRTKGQMEDAGLITTEKVPIDVGRPRQRLRIADDRLEGADATEVISILGSLT